MTKSTVYDTVSWLILLSLLLGLYPSYLQTVGKCQRLKTDKNCTIVIIFHLILFAVLLYFASLEKNPLFDGQLYSFNTFAKLLIFVVSLSGNSAVFIMLIISFMHKKSFKNFVNNVAALDETLAKLGQYINYETDYYVCLAMTITGPLVIIGNIAMELWNMPRENIEPLPNVILACHMLSFLMVHQGETQFVAANVILKTRFKTINNILENLWAKKLIVVKDKKKSRSDEQTIDICMRCHDQLCDMCGAINMLFGFPIIIGCLIQFNTIVFSFCYCYYNISIRPISTLGWFFWSLLRIYELARKAAFAHLNSNEARATLNWVSKLIIRSNPSLEEKLQIFALQLTHRAPTFTALGLFPINGSFAFTVVGAATTYITIIYQFQVNKPTCGP
nr:PREDICTED: putative gustatory receptor 28a [Tribolium castaneum]|eukprot:XP_008195245.1 PREDICTED: putative gustatory receptor 28a [Tribolium castaneum]